MINELCMRGYSVDKDVIPIAERNTEDKVICKQFEKIVITKDIVQPYYDEYGILTVNIYDFLLNPQLLENKQCKMVEMFWKILYDKKQT